MTTFAEYDVTFMGDLYHTPSMYHAKIFTLQYQMVVGQKPVPQPQVIAG